jgi:hypothetical protein
LLRDFEVSLTGDPTRHHPRERSWLDGVKRFFENIGS